MPNLEDLMDVIRKVHLQFADDTCWMDIDKIFAAAGLPVPDRRVGNKEEMKVNCARFIDTMCKGGEWPSYVEIETELISLRKAYKQLNLSHESMCEYNEKLKNKIMKIQEDLDSYMDSYQKLAKKYIEEMQI